MLNILTHDMYMVEGNWNLNDTYRDLSKVLKCIFKHGRVMTANVSTICMYCLLPSLACSVLAACIPRLNIRRTQRHCTDQSQTKDAPQKEQTRRISSDTRRKSSAVGQMVKARLAWKKSPKASSYQHQVV